MPSRISLPSPNQQKMSISEELFIMLVAIKRGGSYVHNGYREFIKHNFARLKRYSSKRESKCLDTVIKTMKTSLLKAEQRKELKSIWDSVSDVIDKYEDQLDADSDSESESEQPDDEDSEEETDCEYCEENLSDEDREEAALDSKIYVYNKYTQKNPMRGIHLCSKQSPNIKYKTRHHGAKKLVTVRRQMLDYYCINAQHPVILSGHQKHILKNNQCSLIKYSYSCEEYYDIRHVLYNLFTKRKTTVKKYAMVRKEIKAIIAHKNQFGGYIFRELVSISAIKLIIASTITPRIISMMELLGIESIDCKIISKEAKFIGCIIKAFATEVTITQYAVGKYRVDLYFPNYNLVIECDEFGHADRDPEKEIARQKYIEDALDAEFIRFNPDAPDFDIIEIISLIHSYIAETVKSSNQ